MDKRLYLLLEHFREPEVVINHSEEPFSFDTQTLLTPEKWPLENETASTVK